MLIGLIVHETLNSFFSIPGKRNEELLFSILREKAFNLSSQNTEYNEILSEAEVITRNFCKFGDLTAFPEFREENITVNFPEFYLICKVDRLEKTGNGWEITDYKTGKIQMTEEELSVSLPNRIYPLAVRYALGLEVKTMTLLYLRAMKKVSVKISPEDLVQTERLLNTKVNEIKRMKQEDFFPKKNPFCNNCEFKLFCPESGNKSVSPVSGSNTREFLRGLEPVYNRLMEESSFKKLTKKIPEDIAAALNSDWAGLFWETNENDARVIVHENERNVPHPGTGKLIEMSKQAIMTKHVFKHVYKNQTFLCFPLSKEEGRFHSNIIIPAPVNSVFLNDLEYIHYIVKGILEKLINTFKNYELRKDGLTGLFMQRYFKEEVETLVLGEETFSIMMVDIDFFKKVNDQFGHLFGDFILKSVSQVIRENLRDVDFCSRYGGEEFGIILPGLDEVDAYFIAERIRKKILKKIFKSGNTQAKITVSLGVSSYPSDSVNASELIDKADKALYCSKEKGRNFTSVISKVKQ